MYTLYGSQGSGSAAVEAALDMAQLPYRIVDAAFWAPGSAIAELGQLNPLRQIPTLALPDGHVLNESAAILIHPGPMHPNSRLLPSAKAPGALDLLAGVVSKWSGTRAHLQTVRPEFLATLHRIESQPRIAAVFARHWDA